MDETLWGLVNILGPIILLLLLVWLIFRGRKRAHGRGEVPEDVTEAATRENYAAEEQRRRDGVDGL